MIDIKMYAAPKPEGATTNSQVILAGGNASSSDFEPHYIFGQYFDDTKDINGDMIVNGTATIDFVKSLQVDTNRAYIGYAGIDTAYINNLDSNNAYISNLRGSSAKLDFADIMKSVIGELRTTSLTTDYLTVLKSAHFFELVIDQIKASGGAVIFTPANGFTVRKVQTITGGYRLYFLSQDTDGNIYNMWKIADQAICQNFNRAEVGTNYNVSNKYYWTLVTNTNNDDNNGNAVLVNVGTDENTDMQYCHYIDISDTTYDGDLMPEVGDEIAMLGYRGNDDEARQNAIYISSYNSLDADLKAPLIVQYRGINDFNLSNHKYTWFSGGVTAQGESNGIRANEIRGSFKVTDGTTLEDYIQQQTQYNTYRMIASPTEIVKDASNNLSVDTVRVTILQTRQGQVTQSQTIPQGLKLVAYTLKNNVYSEYLTINQLNSAVIALDNTVKEADYLELRLIETGTNQTKDTQRISVTYIDNSNTQVDRIIDTGTVTLMSYDSEHETYSLQYSLKALIYHYDGTNFIQVTDSTSPANTEYTFRISLFKADNTESNIETKVANTIYSNNEYTFTSSNIEWNKTDKNYVYMRIQLIKSSQVVDSITKAILLTPNASLDIIQGEVAKITATITGNEETWNNSYAYLSNYISQVELTARENKSYIGSITSYVNTLTGEVQEKVSWSYILQNANLIQFSIIDDLRRTGIDIESGKITLDSAYTYIVGNLNLTYSSYGITIYDNDIDSVPRINLQRGSISGYDKVSNGLFTPSRYASGQLSHSTGNITLQLIDDDIINIKNGQQLLLSGVNIYAVNSGGTSSSTATFTSTPTLEIAITNANDSSNVLFSQQYTLVARDNGVYNWGLNKESYKEFAYEHLQQDTNIKVRFTISGYTPNSRDAYINIHYNTQVGNSSQTFIGKNGMYSQQMPLQYMWLDSDEGFEVRRMFNGLRLKTYGITQEFYNSYTKLETAALTTYYTNSTSYVAPLWLPIYNYIPMTVLNSSNFKSGATIGSLNEYKAHVYQLNPADVYGDLMVVEPYNRWPDEDPYGSNTRQYQESWILLPAVQFTDPRDNLKKTLPVGYRVTIIKEFDGANLYVGVAGNQDYRIRDSNLNMNRYFSMNSVNSTRATFIYIGGKSENDIMWITIEDT